MGPHLFQTWGHEIFNVNIIKYFSIVFWGFFCLFCFVLIVLFFSHMKNGQKSQAQFSWWVGEWGGGGGDI